MTVIKIGITGSEGRIGRYLVSRGCVPLVCDITDPRSVSAELHSVKPTIVINCAGASDVDWCEDNYDEARKLNVRGFYNLCSQAALTGIKVVGLSSDHVFSGNLWYPFTYNEKSKPHPVNDYGWTKWGMEAVALTYFNAYIVRTSFVFDKVRLAPEIQKYQSRGGAPFYPVDIIRSFIHMDVFVTALTYHATNIEKMPKVLHIAGTRSASWYDFMVEYFKSLKIPTNLVTKRHYKEIDGKASRPKRTPLNVKLALKLGFQLHEFEKDF